jgi:hypothetical protein
VIAAHETVVTRWFGEHFAELHPLLQTLHREGGSLHGRVSIRAGRGLAGWLGRRLARSLGIPIDREERGFDVDIRHTSDALEWRRRFDDGSEMISRFEPVGRWPDGYWLERTGALHMRLTVDIVDGGWIWCPLRASLHGIPLPLALLPRSRAGKRIEGDRYVFEVAFALPLLGDVLSYGGLLDARPLHQGRI